MAQITIEDGMMVIRVALNVRPAPSQSGKSQIIDSTQGFVGVATPNGTCKVGLNVITTDANWQSGVASGKPAAAPSLVSGPGKTAVAAFSSAPKK